MIFQRGAGKLVPAVLKQIVEIMDPLTHALSGVVWSKTGPIQRWGKPATWTLIGATLLPDVDHITLRLLGPMAYLKYHRGFTHSIIGGLLLALLLAGLVYIIIRGSRKLGYLRLFGLSILGIYTHILLDFITSYGTQLLFPFSTYRYSLDLVFIVDPYLTLIFLTPLVFMRFSKIRIAHIALSLAGVYLVMAFINQGLASAKGNKIAREMGIEVVRYEAFPLPLSPFRWSVIVEDRWRYYQMNLDILRDNRFVQVFEKGPRDDNIIKRAEGLEIVKTYLWFARFPIITLKEIKGGHLLEYYDLRFNLLPPRKPFLLRVVLGEDGSFKEGNLLFHLD